MQKPVSLICAIYFWLLLPAWAADFPARHDHLRKSCLGTLHLDASGVAFQESVRTKKPHAWQWAWQDVQLVELSTDRLRIRTYRNRDFVFLGERFDQAYPQLKDRLDQRFIARLADPDVRPLWEIPVKRIHGGEGKLVVGESRIVYESTKRNESITWRYKDIRNISTSDPFQFTLVTLQEQFNFLLKEALSEDRYNQLWRRLNVSSGLRLIAPGASALE